MKRVLKLFLLCKSPGLRSLPQWFTQCGSMVAESFTNLNIGELPLLITYNAITSVQPCMHFLGSMYRLYFSEFNSIYSQAMKLETQCFSGLFRLIIFLFLSFEFKTGLMSIIKQKLANREGGGIDRSRDITRLQEFYRLYREKNNVDKLREEEMELRESGTFSGNFQELERKTVKRKKVFATLKVLGTVIEQLAKEVSPEEAEGLIPQDLKRVIESDAAMTEDLIAYNIIPLDAPGVTNAITSFPEVRAAISSLKYFRGLPKLPANFPIPANRSADMLDFLHYVFGFQKGNVSNQRENIVNLLSNEQSRLGTPDEHEPKLNETAVERVFLKSLDNYIKWCNYLSLPLMWSNSDISKEKKILFLSLYFLIWGEAANVRFLPECLCYIFHHMGIELVELLSEQLAKPANSCVTENGVSFLEQVICPLYDVIPAEADNNQNGKAPHSAWRNYDDFNEYFWCIGYCGYVWCLFYNKDIGRFTNFHSFHLVLICYHFHRLSLRERTAGED